ncbi:MAG: OmpA family protein [Novosphingobium sp.]|jgi:outer membrane protein OmpA-like peptidoglycan-associated protein|nr:OmpA family protein [Novosphingobium sp.]
MEKSRLLVSSIAAVSLVAVSGCVTDPNTGERKVSRTAIGTGVGVLGGLLLGGLIGGGTGRIIGAGIGGVAGAAIGYTTDKQIRELREKTAGTGVDISPTDNGQAILVNLPEGVTFDVDSTALQPNFRPTLDQIAQSLSQYPDSLIDVYGHTDSTGSEQYNQTLSENRARTVAGYLEMRGVSPSRIRSQGFGETLPVADNNTEEGRRRNRRVEIKIVPISQEQVQAAQHQQQGY